MSSVQKRAADDRPGSRVLVVVLCVVAALLSGCDTLNWQQYKISGIHAHSADADRLESVVMGIAGRYALTDATQTSHVQDTLLLVTEPDVRHFHTDIGVRLYGDDALVDVMAGFGPRVEKFARVRDALGPALTAEFGARCVAIAPQDRVQPIDARPD